MFNTFGCTEATGRPSYSRRVSLVVTLFMLFTSIGMAFHSKAIPDIPPMWAVLCFAPYGINKMAAAVKAIAEAVKR